ncbi:MAG: M23 family metallopeptidase [Candidatus Improbicoccus devescovinae]|nr:MAG: M23 family metallopeptidase [Candidatus Improbicoccus devescovinae]
MRGSSFRFCFRKTCLLVFIIIFGIYKIEALSVLEHLKKLKFVIINKIDGDKKEVFAQNQQTNDINFQIHDLESKIILLNTNIQNLNLEISKNRQKITEQESKIKDIVLILKECLRSVHRADNPTFIEILVKAKNFKDFIDKAEITKFLTDKITATIVAVNESIDALDQLKKDNERKLGNVHMQRKIIDQKRVKLGELLKQTEESRKHVQSNFDIHTEELKKIEKEIQTELTKELEAQHKLQEQKRQQAPYAHIDEPHKGIKHIWPVEGFKVISSGFFDRLGRKAVHHAIDIAGQDCRGRSIFGASVRAPADGKVFHVTKAGNGGGYGYHVRILHKDGSVTILAHLSKVDCEKGDFVTAGQIVGQVGSTGHSTGAHLHWELRDILGRPQNPLRYL